MQLSNGLTTSQFTREPVHAFGMGEGAPTLDQRLKIDHLLKRHNVDLVEFENPIDRSDVRFWFQILRSPFERDCAQRFLDDLAAIGFTIQSIGHDGQGKRCIDASGRTS